MSRMALQSLLAEFGVAMGIEDLAFDGEQRCNLMFDDVAVSFELGADEASLCMYSRVGSEPSEDVERQLSSLLKANYAFAATRGATLALDPAGGGILLMREEPLETLWLPRFESVVEDFVNVAESFTRQLANQGLQVPGEASATDAGARANDSPEAPQGGTMRV